MYVITYMREKSDEGCNKCLFVKFRFKLLKMDTSSGVVQQSQSSKFYSGHRCRPK